MTDKQREELLRLKAQGFSKEQAIAKVFTSKTATQPKKEGRFEDVGEDLSASFMGVGRDLTQRGDNIVEGFKAKARGEQSAIETGAQMAGNILGGAGDIAFRGIQAAVTPFMKESEERAVEQKVGDVFAPVGEFIGKQSPRTQRNITGGLGLFEGVTTALAPAIGSTVMRPLKGVFSRSDIPKLPTPDGVPPPPPAPIVRQTPEKLFSNVETDLQRISKDPSLTPAERAAAAESSLTIRERFAGVRPDEKKRIQEMAPGTLERYFDQAHMRNVDDMVDSPYTIGAKRADEALEGLNTRLTETGGIIGNTRQKLATYRLGVDEINLIESKLVNELSKLNLSIRNGQIGVTPGKIAKTASNSDINTLQTLYNDTLTFKQSPTVANAIDLRMKFDGKINFDKSAREASNSVDPVSKSVRSALADGAAKVVGKTEARELARYSDFMEAYADLKSFTDRAAGGEYLLRLVLSGRGGDAKKLINTVKSYTGIDLMDDALAMKLATDIIGNDSQKNLFRQEVSKAGLDAARLFSGDLKGFTEAIAQKLIDKGVNPEDVYRAIAAGTAGYVLMTYMDEEGLSGAGVAVLGSMSPQVRKQALKQADEIAKSTGKTLKVADDLKDGVQMALKDVDMNKLQSPGGRAGGSTVDFDDIDELDRLKAGMETPDGLTDIDFIEAQALLEKYNIPYKGKTSSFNKGATEK